MVLTSKNIPDVRLRKLLLKWKAQTAKSPTPGHARLTQKCHVGECHRKQTAVDITPPPDATSDFRCRFLVAFGISNTHICHNTKSAHMSPMRRESSARTNMLRMRLDLSAMLAVSFWHTEWESSTYKRRIIQTRGHSNCTQTDSTKIRQCWHQQL